jgi:hypothetical protein
MMNQKFNIWMTDPNASGWLKKGSPLKCSDSRSEAGEFSLAEASERCCLVFDGRPLCAMVPASMEPIDQPIGSHYACSWEHRLSEIKIVSLARGIIEGVASASPEISEKLKEAAGYLSGSCKTALGDDGEGKPHETPLQSQTSHGEPS